MRNEITLADYLMSPAGGRFMQLLHNETKRLGSLPAAASGYDYILLNEAASELDFLLLMGGLNAENIASGKAPLQMDELAGNIVLAGIADAEPERVLDSIREWTDTDGAFGLMDCEMVDGTTHSDSVVRRERIKMFRPWATDEEIAELG